MKPCILFRGALAETGEQSVATNYFAGALYELRSQVPDNSLVVGRYSVLPYYKELEEDLATKDSHLINNYRQHRYIAHLGNWYRDLEGLTPLTWHDLDAIPEEYRDKELVLKGETNSIKSLWRTHMYANGIHAAEEVMHLLHDDGLLCNQDIFIREYVPLKSYGRDISGCPISHEFRTFVLYGQVLTTAFYWSNHWDDIKSLSWEPPPQEFLHTVIDKVGRNANFYVIDTALTEKGKWVVIELNDGQQSGLSTTSPVELYGRLANALHPGCVLTTEGWVEL